MGYLSVTDIDLTHQNSTIINTDNNTNYSNKKILKQQNKLNQSELSENKVINISPTKNLIVKNMNTQSKSVSKNIENEPQIDEQNLKQSNAHIIKRLDLK